MCQKKLSARLTAEITTQTRIEQANQKMEEALKRVERCQDSIRWGNQRVDTCFTDLSICELQFKEETEKSIQCKKKLRDCKFNDISAQIKMKKARQEWKGVSEKLEECRLSLTHSVEIQTALAWNETSHTQSGKEYRYAWEICQEQLHETKEQEKTCREKWEVFNRKEQKCQVFLEYARLDYANARRQLNECDRQLKRWASIKPPLALEEETEESGRQHVNSRVERKSAPENDRHLSDAKRANETASRLNQRLGEVEEELGIWKKVSLACVSNLQETDEALKELKNRAESYENNRYFLDLKEGAEKAKYDQSTITQLSVEFQQWQNAAQSLLSTVADSEHKIEELERELNASALKIQRVTFELDLVGKSVQLYRRNWEICLSEEKKRTSNRSKKGEDVTNPFKAKYSPSNN